MVPFIKIIPPGAYDFSKQADVRTSLVKMSDRGLIGDDLSSMIKRASTEMVSQLRHMDRIPGERLIHVLALGATESFGPNRNGDGFDRDECRSHHDTFRKMAKWYRGHRNKDPHESYGEVKLSCFNEAMQRIELIVGLNGTEKLARQRKALVADEELQDLESGIDLPVSMACPLAGTLVKLKRGFRKVEEIQPGDEVLTHRGRYRPVYATMQQTKSQYARISTRFCGRQPLEFTPEHKFYVIRKNDRVLSFGPSDLSHRFAQWLECGKLQPGDILLIPIPYGDDSSPLTIDEARLLGYSMSESNDPVDTDLTGLQRFRRDLTSGLEEDTDTAICELVGRAIHDNGIPQEVIDAPREVRRTFLNSWLSSDGYKNRVGLHWNAGSQETAIELQMLLASIGIPANIDRCIRTDQREESDRRGSQRCCDYEVTAAGNHLFDLSSDLVFQPLETGFITGGYLAIPVEKVELIEDKVEVYDLSVEEDESFTAFGIVVHNCKVAFDVCSGCGNRARNRSEYCTEGTCKYGGLKRNISKVASDGHWLHAKNPRPGFFDISRVKRGADRTAWVLGAIDSRDFDLSPIKEAAVEDREACGAEIADFYRNPWNDSVFSWGMKLGAQQQADVLIKLARLETSLPATSSASNLAFDRRVTRAPVERVKTADGRAMDLSTHLRALADENVLLDPESFARLATRDGVLSSNIVEKMASSVKYLPGIFNQLVDTDDLEQALTENPYRVSMWRSNYPIREWAIQKKAEYGIDRETIKNRYVRQALQFSGAPVQHLEKVAFNDPRDCELAKHYALYQLAFLAHPRDSADTDHLVEMVIRNNRHC